MINCYAGVMDTNLVRPISVDRTEVIFDFYFADVSESAREQNLASVAVGDRIQQEDLDICASVQRGLKSRAYDAGRLSVRREAGEHLFHRLLHERILERSVRMQLSVRAAGLLSTRTLRTDNYLLTPGSFFRDLVIAWRKEPSFAVGSPVMTPSV